MSQTAKDMTVPVGTNLINHIAAEVRNRNSKQSKINAHYNERHIDGGPSWREHTNYMDGGQHGQTNRPK